MTTDVHYCQLLIARNIYGLVSCFIRWYSPRDFVEGEEEEAEEECSGTQQQLLQQPHNTAAGAVPRRGRLSTRMSVEGNIWMETWSQGKNLISRSIITNLTVSL